MIGRRNFLLSLAGGGLALGRAGEGRTETPARAAGSFDQLEARSGGRLGVAVHDLETGRRLAHRARQAFPMCSTFKMLAAAAVLSQVDRGQDQLGRRIDYRPTDLVSYSPVTEKHVGDGMTLADLCEAAVTLSDNTAANLLLRQIGGPPGLTRYARGLGDRVTRLDRWETALGECVPGDPRDTTSPDAMVANLRKLLLGDALSLGSRERLTDWMVATQTGGAKLRAGVPADWRVGDKTGSGDRGTSNDIAILWPPGRKPILVAAYLTGSTLKGPNLDAVLADVGRIVAAEARA